MTGSGQTEKPKPLPAEEVADHFPELEMLSLLGSGGMGSVYKARQLNLDRLVAVKILRHDAPGPDFVERFAREAQTLARLDHPNIVAIHDFGERNGLFYFIMELIDGVTLRQLLSGGPIPTDQALRIIPPVCDALQFAHERSVVHRDIKPENILIDQQGRVKVADFGIARLTAEKSAAEPSDDESDRIAGTPNYMAPEQIRKPGETDHRADIYALGVVLYEMLTGQLPPKNFPEPSQRDEIDVQLNEIVRRTLDEKPEKRYQQASEIRTAIETLQTSPHGKPTSFRTLLDWLFRPFYRLSGFPLLAAGGFVLLATALAGWRSGIHADGVIDLHYGPNTPFGFHLLQNLINWSCMLLFLLPFGWKFSRGTFAFSDFLGAQAVARWPYLPATLIMGIPVYRDAVEILSMDLMASTQTVPDIAFIRDAILLLLLTLPSLILTVWMVWLMYHGYTKTFQLRGQRAIWSFVFAIIAAEIISKIIIWSVAVEI